MSKPPVLKDLSSLNPRRNQESHDQIDETGQRVGQVPPLLRIEVYFSRVSGLIPNDPASPKNFFQIRRKIQALDLFVKGFSFPAKVGSENLEAQAKKGARSPRRFPAHCLSLAEDFSSLTWHVCMRFDSAQVRVDHLSAKPDAWLFAGFAESNGNFAL